jgi:DMSO/TMAO reductase YedYZ heme-binding membrane subunit
LSGIFALSSNKKNLFVLFGVALSAAIASAMYLRAAGTTDENLNLLLRLTARISFMTYLLIFVARPLRQIFPRNGTRWLSGERRSFGIAFAAMHSVHLGLIAYRFSTIPGLEYPVSSALLGGTAYALMYLMLITSFDRPARALGPKNWRRLHKIGLYYIGLIFLSTLLPDPGDAIFTIERAWFVILTAGAAFIRLTAYLAQKKRR